jgi:hypothetical protein
MIQSEKLNALFAKYSPYNLIDICDSLFNRVYTKTRWATANPGLYLFYSKDKSDSFIDKYQDPSPYGLSGRNVIVIHGYDEEYIINAILKFDKLKAFL